MCFWALLYKLGIRKGLQMEQVVEKIAKAMQEVTSEKGDFTLVALVHRETAVFDLWDLLISASWLQNVEQLDALRYITDKLQSYLSDEEILNLAMTVILEQSHQFVIELNQLYEGKQDDLGPQDLMLTNLELNYAYIIISNPTTELAIA